MTEEISPKIEKTENGYTFTLSVRTLARIAQDGLVIMTFTGIVLGPLWLYYISAPLNALSKRVESLEQTVKKTQENFVTQDKSQALVIQRLDGIERRLDLILKEKE